MKSSECLTPALQLPERMVVASRTLAPTRSRLHAVAVDRVRTRARICEGFGLARAHGSVFLAGESARLESILPAITSLDLPIEAAELT